MIWGVVVSVYSSKKLIWDSENSQKILLTDFTDRWFAEFPCVTRPTGSNNAPIQLRIRKIGGKILMAVFTISY